MNWLLDVHFEKDRCRVESKDVQQSLNMFGKAAINLVKQFKSQTKSKQVISNVMFQCLFEPQMILIVVGNS
jgi:hypothetical protein